MGKKINNYIEYQKRLKEFFSGIKEMPSSEEVQSFIDKYNLFRMENNHSYLTYNDILS